MDVQVWMASKEVADRLDVHVRTLRNWLEMFVPVQERLKNPQGHYLISETGFSLLREVKERKEEGKQSLREIQRQLIEEGRLPASILTESEVAAADEQALAVSGQGAASPQEMQVAITEAIVQFQQELAQLSHMSQMQSTLLQKLADIEEMQESLRLEMRRVTFEMDLMQQRLTRRKERFERHQSRWSLNPFRWFTRSGRDLTAGQ
ncbi:MerR family transcriptional regulator [Brevibacillus composti]|uniref:MerR family transcriptional regulator n=1 Tax=Brevibacillus composti TaxID=2796470 RepID=A0A7T5EN73_9BACL|nr:MerR family transcriptional regulator [Brevibacillus composti]QQE75668.1 MerR family transcriptional regulator [Brevibacillus composti]QUO42694.1 MerR family transcriptional regulator [Brevibacillus composti]